MNRRIQLGLERLAATKNGGRDWKNRWIAENAKTEWAATERYRRASEAWSELRRKQEAEWRCEMISLARMLKSESGTETQEIG
jgi:hypothetical protein